MKKNISETSLNLKHYLFRQKIISVVLCFCLMLVSLPMEFYGSRVLAEGIKQKVLSFVDLDEEVKQQTVDVGTELEDLNLPETLIAVGVSEENKNNVYTEDFSHLNHSSEEQGLALDEKESLTEETQELSESVEEETGLEENQEIPENPENLEEIENTSEEVVNPPEETSETPIGDSGSYSVPDTEPEPEPEPNVNLEKTIAIENITWVSIPRYDSKTEGTYIFTPILPENYVLEGRVELPKIYVTVKSDEIPEEYGRKREQDTEEGRKKSEIEEEIIEEIQDRAEGTEYFALSSPGCGVISENTVWNESGSLSDGELVIDSGITLTINSALTISGNVTIQGGGIIVRGNGSARIVVNENCSLTMKNITLDGREWVSTYSMLTVENGNLTLDDGCRIQNCIRNGDSSMGGAISLDGAKAVFNDAIIENCSAGSSGGAVYAGNNSNTTINKGIYRNNKTTSSQTENGTCGGGFIINSKSKLYIYGGSFVENTTVGRGGAIYHSGNEGTETYIYGGTFQGNFSSWEKYAGSGAIWISSISTSETCFDISSNVKFCGDGTDSGVDGIYLDSRNSTPRRIKISNTLSHLVTLYVKAIEGYVIAEGNGYTLLHKRDMKKIKFVDVGDSGKNGMPY